MYKQIIDVYFNKNSFKRRVFNEQQIHLCKEGGHTSYIPKNKMPKEAFEIFYIRNG